MCAFTQKVISNYKEAEEYMYVLQSRIIQERSSNVVADSKTQNPAPKARGFVIEFCRLQ